MPDYQASIASEAGTFDSPGRSQNFLVPPNSGLVRIDNMVGKSAFKQNVIIISGIQ